MLRDGSASVDLFAGAGGWDVAARELGFDPLGIELDEQACATRQAAGFRTLCADIAALDPMDFAPCDFLIASPPCTAFSMAGKGKGRDALNVYATAIQHMRLGAAIDREWLDKQCDDATAHLVLEPLRWALALKPTFIACEQVPPVLPLWQFMADVLRERGYSTWTGVLEAERYGVPQTRERAILMASKAGTVHPPRATHQRYVPGEPARHEITLEGELLPWISMADALGWEGVDICAPTVSAGGTDTGGPEPFAKGGRERINRARGTHYDRRQQSNGTPVRLIPVTDPAPTIASEGLAKGRDIWVQRERSGDRAEEGFDPVEEPCQTLTEKARSWTVHRPTTAIQGDARVFSPGGHIANDGRDNSKMVGRSENAVRISVEEAAILQSFPPDHPWQGSRTAQFRQIGNAVPPLLARAILSALLEEVTDARQAA